MVQEEYFSNKRREILDEIQEYEDQIQELSDGLKFETDPKKHAKLRQQIMELESAIQIAQAKFNVLDREREDQIKAERVAIYNDLKERLAEVKADCTRMENRLYMLLAKKLVPLLDDMEKTWVERSRLESQINILAIESDMELEAVLVTPPRVLGLLMKNNDLRAPSIAETLVGAIQRHHQIFQNAIQRGIKPNFKLSKELLAEVGEFGVNSDGSFRSRSPEQEAADRMMLEGNRNRTVIKKAEVN
jgi:hypothetical protein